MIRDVFAWVLGLVILFGGAGCAKQSTTRGESGEMAIAAAARGDMPTRGSVAARRDELLQRIRAADPDRRLIERALMNERNELGLVLGRQTDLDEIPKLMRAMLAQMDRAFPGQDHTVVAYTPTEPPRVIGTGRLDARTRDMTYTPASP